jgi:hypothetical protein
MTVTIPFTFVGGTVISSSQVNANFSALANAVNVGTRTILTVDTTFYVSPTGSDNGPATNPAQPAATVNYVIGLLQSQYDINGKVVTIQLANGTYNQAMVLHGAIPGQTIQSQLIIQGNTGSPSSVVIDGGALASFTANSGAGCQLQGLHIQSTGSVGLLSSNNSSLLFGNCEFGACTSSQILASRQGAVATTANYSIVGPAAFHFFGSNNSNFYLEGLHSLVVAPPAGQPTVTITGTPAWGTAFIGLNGASVANVFATFTGSATGVRAMVMENSVIHSGGNPNIGTTYLPGSSNPTTASGGVLT